MNGAIQRAGDTSVPVNESVSSIANETNVGAAALVARVEALLDRINGPLPRPGNEPLKGGPQGLRDTLRQTRSNLQQAHELFNALEEQL